MQISHQIVLIEGHIPTPRQRDGTLTVKYRNHSSPVTTWPVSDSRFKALLYLHSGPNAFYLEFSPAGSRSRYTSQHHLIYHPMTSCPAIKLVIIHAKDSEYAEISPSRSGTTALSIAMAKYRMAAYLWQVFTAEQMGARESPRRTFQLENEWSDSTLFTQDIHTDEMRNEAPVHVVPLDYTLNEVSNMSDADFVRSVEAALMKRFAISHRQTTYFSCLFMDSDWDPSNRAFARGCAYGGPGFLNEKNIRLSVFGDNALFSYPSSIDRVTAAFSDETPTPRAMESTRWRSAAAGIGAHLQQVFHMLGLPQQQYGIMSEESSNFASMFSLYASHKLCSPKLHPLDAIRLRHHPTMRSPFAPLERIRPHTAPAFWGVSDSVIHMTSRAGFIAVEIYNPGDTVCKYWMNLLDKRGHPRSNYELTMADITKQTLATKGVSRMSFRPGPYSLMILTADGNATPITDFEKFAKGLVLSDSRRQLHSSRLIGASAPGSEKRRVMFPTSSRMLGLTVFHTPGVCVTGIEFIFETDERLLLGNKSGDSSKEWRLQAIHGEFLYGMELCVQESLQGLRLFTSSGRLSPWFGNATPGTE
jgi:Putative peptidase family